MIFGILSKHRVGLLVNKSPISTKQVSISVATRDDERKNVESTVDYGEKCSVSFAGHNDKVRPFFLALSY